MATSSERPFRLQSLSGGVMCKRDCGYYGLPEQQGLCSKCWRTYRDEQEAGKRNDSRERHAVAEHAPYDDFAAESDIPSSFSGLNFKRFEEKKRHMGKSHAVKQLLSSKRFDDSGATGRPTAIHKLNRSFSSVTPTPNALKDAEAQKVLAEFNSFLETLPRPAAAIIADKVPKRIDQVLHKSDVDALSEETSKLVTDFLERLSEQLSNTHGPSVFKQISEEDGKKLLHYCEVIIQMATYNQLFCPASSDDEERDINLQAKIRKLNWLSSHNLGTTIDEMNSAVRLEMEEAINTILEMDTLKNCPAKLGCITRFCQRIVQVLKLSDDAPANADSLLPAIILVIVRANPARLHSNIKYITRYANPSSLRSGEAGYFFTNLCCAVSFVEQIDAKSLDMSEEEFASCMRGDQLVGGRPSLMSKGSFMNQGIAQIKRDTEAIIKHTETASRVKQEFETLAADTQRLFERFHNAVKRDVEAKQQFDAVRAAYLARRTKPNQMQQNAPESTSPSAGSGKKFSASADTSMRVQDTGADGAMPFAALQSDTTETFSLHLRECRSTSDDQEPSSSVSNSTVVDAATSDAEDDRHADYEAKTD